MKSWGAVIVVAVTLLVPPGSAVAKPGFFVEKPGLIIEFSLPASNGYQVSVGAIREQGRPGSLGVTATRGRSDQDVVEYQARGQAERDGTVHAKLPGVGRIAVRFRPTKVTHETPTGNCEGRGAVVSHGVFRGAIDLHGEHGYMTVDSKSAEGTVSQSFRQVCKRGKPERGKGNPGGSLDAESLFTGTLEGSPSLSFTASLINFGPEAGGTLVSFTASSVRAKDGLSVISSATAQGKPAEFSVSESASGLENAMVEPPPPFRGSASFQLDSPTSSSWEGNLEAELPGVGKVTLAGARYWSALCREESCTKTLPPNVKIFFSGFF